MTNYIVDQNKFKLAGPPKHWLRRLWDFDNSLVVVPSRQGFYYRLAQRRKPNLSTSIVNDILKEHGDTQMLMSYGLTPVTTILATANWSNPFMFEELRRRSVHRMGGAEKVNQDLLAQEQQADQVTQAAIDDHLTYLGKDSWRLYLKKIGLRSHMYSPRTKKPSDGIPNPNRSALILIK